MTVLYENPHDGHSFGVPKNPSVGVSKKPSHIKGRCNAFCLFNN